MLIVESQSMDVYRNLAVEEYLMDRVQDCGPILFLWRSDCAVVIGKNQNPWRECRLDLMEQDGVPLARRISGGGTVYHDAGNLNYCVIVNRETYREDDAYDMVKQALARFGIAAERTGKSNLSMNGLKFSGNAFAFRHGRALHHGTLLLNTDLDRLNRYLGPVVGGIETHAIASVPADVTNLDLEAGAVMDALKDTFHAVYGGLIVNQSDAGLDEKELLVLRDRQVSEVWRYEATPRFDVECGGVRLDVVKGRVCGGEYDGRSFREIALSFGCQID
ncbi:MAG TPA: lipoate--protein ligase family protein [Pontiella sp.]